MRGCFLFFANRTLMFQVIALTYIDNNLYIISMINWSSSAFFPQMLISESCAHASKWRKASWRTSCAQNTKIIPLITLTAYGGPLVMSDASCLDVSSSGQDYKSSRSTKQSLIVKSQTTIKMMARVLLFIHIAFYCNVHGHVARGKTIVMQILLWRITRDFLCPP